MGNEGDHHGATHRPMFEAAPHMLHTASNRSQSREENWKRTAAIRSASKS